MNQYYHNQITQKSWELLQNLKRKYDFILIGGWAVYLYTHSLKSKDIDMVVGLTELNKLKENFVLTKNERLKKYEFKQDEIDIDVYAEFYSNPGLPAEEIKKHTQSREGFIVSRPEVLLILKQQAWSKRRGSAKGEKDKIDMLALLQAGINFHKYQELLDKFNLVHRLAELVDLIKIATRVPELGLNEHQFSSLKQTWLRELKKS